MSLSLLGGLRDRASKRRRVLPDLKLPPDDDPGLQAEQLVLPAPDDADDVDYDGGLPALPPPDLLPCFPGGPPLVSPSPSTELQSPRMMEIEATLGLAPCCKRGCTQNLLSDAAEQALILRQRLQKEDKEKVVFGLVKDAMREKGKFNLFGMAVCQKACSDVLQVSQCTVLKYKYAAANGFHEPPPDQRAHNGSSQSHLEKQLDVDAFFSYLYANVAEPLADADKECQELLHKGHGGALHEWALVRDGNPLAQASAGITSSIDRRYLPFMTWSELFDMYKHFGDAGGGEKAGRQCFDKIYADKWRGRLLIRGVEQHARCDTCARLLKFSRDHPDPVVRADSRKAYHAHLNRMVEDRRMDARLTQLSILSLSDSYAYSGVMHIRIDGMDQAKFRVPRQIENSKQFGQLWRPTLHTVGVIIEGLFEIYLIADADVKKDSNMQCSVLMQALDLAARELQRRGLPMPDNLSVKFDNTAREGKNQTIVKFLAWLVARNVFRSAQDSQCEKGHTHDSLDQRFSVVATILSRSIVLETPDDFIRQVRSLVDPAGKRQLIVDRLVSTWNWQGHFSGLDFDVTGVAATASMPDTSHCKRCPFA